MGKIIVHAPGLPAPIEYPVNHKVFYKTLDSEELTVFYCEKVINTNYTAFQNCIDCHKNYKTWEVTFTETRRIPTDATVDVVKFDRVIELNKPNE